MKFAKELEEELVPEWRIKYLDYRQGKKKIKAITRAIRSGKSRSSTSPLLRRLSSSISIFAPPSREQDDSSNSEAERQQEAVRNTRSNSAITVPRPPIGLRSPPGGTRPPTARGGSTNYGSIKQTSPSSPSLSRPVSLSLPEPALGPISRLDHASSSTDVAQKENLQRSDINSAFEIGKTRHPGPSRLRSFGPFQRSNTVGPIRSPGQEKPLLTRIFKTKNGSTKSRSPGMADVPLEQLQEVKDKQSDFWAFLDGELNKIETFYKSKEDEAMDRLLDIEVQLHIMKEQRHIILEQQRRVGPLHASDDAIFDPHKTPEQQLEGPHSLGPLQNIPHARDVIHFPIKAVQQVRFGKDTKSAPGDSHTPEGSTEAHAPNDYSRKPQSDHVPYVTAKRKLKAAMQEFYRGLELLKSYTLVNRTAFRKINKKYDKAVRDGRPMGYMSDKVNKAHFVKSTLIDNYLKAIEDLYATYFEKSNHKVAVAKLRRRNRQATGFNASVFRNGFAIAGGLIFGIEAVVYGVKRYFENQVSNPELALQTSYLLQLYAGYFLLLLLVLLFCIDCRIFSNAKVNYVFIFEFDTRHNLDWRQLSELPSAFLFLLGLCAWLNFTSVGGGAMYLWWPVVYAAVVGLILFLPAPLLYHESRKWFLYSFSRLLFPGLYAVEWRDFFLGDMLCSQTYSMGGIELFFCLYASNWSNPIQCNSGHSRLLGFLTTLPGIIRFCQCLRRYADTKDKYPHLLNALKYIFTTMQYMSLSLYRIDQTVQFRGLFITFGTLNSIMTIYWDIVHDWSLGDPTATHKFLREHLAYKQVWWYYTAAVIDFLLRWNWIPYSIPALAPDIQHSALLGFAISMSEVVRRGIWTVFRVENEHVANVRRFKASRDVELPYKVKSQSQADYARKRAGSKKRLSLDPLEEDDIADQRGPYDGTTSVGSPHTNWPSTSAVDIERGPGRSPAVSSLRRRQQQQQQDGTPSLRPGSLRARMGKLVHTAHAQDFERKKNQNDIVDHDSDDEDDADIDSDEGPSGPPHHSRADNGARTALDRRRSYEENVESSNEMGEAAEIIRRARSGEGS